MTTKRIHPLCAEAPDLSTPQKHLDAVALSESDEAEFGEAFDQLWLGLRAGGTVRRFGTKYVIAVDVPVGALRHLTRYAHDEQLGHWDRLWSDAHYGDLLPDHELGQDAIPPVPHMPDGNALAKELEAEDLIAYTADADGLVVHSPFGDEPTGPQVRTALATRTWPASIEAAHFAVERASGRVSSLVLSLCDDDKRAAWCASMRSRIEVIDAIALGELHPTSDELLARWAILGHGHRLRLALASAATIAQAA